MKRKRKIRLVYDIEADGLLATVTKIHCLSIIDASDGSLTHYPPDKIKTGLLKLYNADEIYCHNQVAFDIPLIKKFYPRWREPKVYDTLLLSQLIYPDIGKHGLEAWGERFGVPKPPIEDWSEYNEGMKERVNEDVKINFLLYQKMAEELASGIWEDAIQLEQEVMRVHQRQIANGVFFDVESAKELLIELNDKIDTIDKELKVELPKRCVKLNNGVSVKKIYKKDGTYTANVLKYFDGSPPVIKGEYTRISFEDINIGSVDQIKKYLFSLGWIPDEWNNKKLPDGSWMRTSPKITESSLKSIGHTHFGKLYLERMLLRHRRNMIQSEKGGGFLPNVREDGTIAADATIIGTPTARYRHKVVANLPRPTTIYGMEIRSLFKPYNGYVQVGVDLSGIEARAMVEYCLPYIGGQELHDLVLHGDFHQHNADLLECDRNTAKSFLYATMYGAGAKKLAAILGCSVSRAKKLIKSFWDGNPALKALKVDVEKKYKTCGYIKGWDGRKLTIRSPHKLLNSLFQNFGAIVFKKWMVNIQSFVDDNDLDVKQMIAYHDEMQYSVRPIFAGHFGRIVCDKAIQTGKQLGIKTKIEADASIGMSWAATH